MAPQFQAYHNATAAQHQAYVTQLSAEGFNPISLSVYGDPSNALYAAVWVKGPSPFWIAVHNIDANGYQNWINTTVEPQGYRVVIVSVTGSGSNLVFAAVALKDSVGWMARHGMTNGGLSDPNSFQSQCQDALNNNMILRSLSIYGTAVARTYAATWEANAGNIQWSFVMDASAGYYQNYFNAAVMGGGRPAYTAMSSDALCAGYFRNDWVGPWVARQHDARRRLHSRLELRRNDQQGPKAGRVRGVRICFLRVLQPHASERRLLRRPRQCRSMRKRTACKSASSPARFRPASA